MKGEASAATVRVALPPHLRHLAGVRGDLRVEVGEPATIGRVMDAVEAGYPVLRGTIRDHSSLERRPMIRYFACGEDLSHEPPDTALPRRVTSGEEVLHVVGALAGG